MKNTHTLPEMKNTLQGIKNRVDEAEDQISNLGVKKQKTSNQNSTGKNSKKLRIV